MQPKRYLMPVLVLAIVLLAGAAVPASASPPESITIAMNGHLTGPSSAEGVYTVTGAVADSGTYTETFRFAGKTIHSVKTLTGVAGTATLEIRAVVVFLTPTTVTFKAGNWRLASGTGVYAELHAGGTPALTPDSFGDLATGVVHVTHEGQAH
jgi:hypothetical protein